MSSLNKVQLIGNLGADPEVKTLPDGTALTNLRIATSERWRDKTTGDTQERTEWHRVSLFGKLAEIAGQYLAKGSKVYLEGQLRTRKWQAQDGTDRYSTEIVLSGPRAAMTMLDPRTRDTTTSATPYRQPKTQAELAASAAAQAPAPAAADFDDDIPF